MTDVRRRLAILEEAAVCVSRDRAATHGDAEQTFGRIAALWSGYLGAEISDVDVTLMMGLVKIARARGNPGHADNFVDLAGYAACGGELADG